MIDLAFRHPGILWAALPLIVAVWLAGRWRRRRVYLAFSTADWIQRLQRRPSVLRRLPMLAIAAALASIVVALMDPMRPSSDLHVTAQGLDIVLVMDLSSSMLEPMDFTPGAATTTLERRRTRLDTTKDALKSLIARRRGDRLGLVVFSDHPYLVSPLTFDHENLFKYVDMLDEQILRGEGMTAIGDGVGLATQLLARQSPAEGNHKLIVVFTDGENNTGRDPVSSLAEADAAGLRIHVIGIDLEEDVKKKPAVLQLIAAVRRQGGQYFNADTTRELRAAYETIDRMERGSLSGTATVREEPAYPSFAQTAAALLLLALGLRALPVFRDLT